MNGRCECCKYRNCIDCEDGYYSVPANCICNNFELDFDALSDKQKKTIQKILMRKGNER